jgi:hypothetical protein
MNSPDVQESIYLNVTIETVDISDSAIFKNAVRCTYVSNWQLYITIVQKIPGIAQGKLS